MNAVKVLDKVGREIRIGDVVRCDELINGPGEFIVDFIDRKDDDASTNVGIYGHNPEEKYGNCIACNYQVYIVDKAADLRSYDERPCTDIAAYVYKTRPKPNEVDRLQEIEYRQGYRDGVYDAFDALGYVDHHRLGMVVPPSSSLNTWLAALRDWLSDAKRRATVTIPAIAPPRWSKAKHAT